MSDDLLWAAFILIFGLSGILVIDVVAGVIRDRHHALRVRRSKQEQSNK